MPGQWGGLRYNGASQTLSVFKTNGVEAPALTTTAVDKPIPRDQWVWIEVHQKLGESSADAPVSEIYVNGQLAGDASTDPNLYAASTTTTALSIGAQAATQPGATGLVDVQIDRASILGSERGALGAPATPTGLRSENDQIYWNAVPGATKYRVYFRNGGPWWTLSEETGTSMGCWIAEHGDYRVTSVNSSGIESNVSAPQTLC
jgi:hypothetical protein